MTRRNHLVTALITAVLLASCSTPAPPPATAPVEAAAPAEQAVIGFVRVTATALNVRREPSTNAEPITLAKKGSRLALLERGDSWVKVRLDDGSTGWVTRQYVSIEGEEKTASKKTARRGCLPDSDFAFLSMPTPSFSDSSRHGLVAVDAYVDASGSVTSTKLISNTTGDEALAFLTEREIKSAKFVAPVRSCVRKPFIFTYKRSF